MQGWVSGIVVLAVSLLLCGTGTPAAGAEWYLDAGVGATHHVPMRESGTWWQADQPYAFDTTALAWRAGVGVALTEHWAIQAGYVSLGEVRSRTKAVADEHFDFAAQRCIASCDRIMDNKAWEPVTGWEAFGRYTWHPGWVDPYLTAGVARLTHRTYSASTRVAETEWHHADVVLGGAQWVGRIGGGLCYQWVCADTTYYHGLTGLDNAISERALMTIIGLQVPLGWRGQ